MTAMPSSVNVAGACNNVVSDGALIFQRQRWKSVAECSNKMRRTGSRVVG